MRKGFCSSLILAALAFLASACATVPTGQVPKSEFAALETAIAGHITTLASDEYLGRRPGTEGETLTLDYLQRELEAAGFVSGTNDPGNPWRAPVPLISTLPEDGSARLRFGRREVVLDTEDTLVLTNWQRSLVNGSDMLFVGRLGDEVSEAEVRGKVIVLLADPGQSASRRDDFFTKGAGAVITVVNDEEDVEALRIARSTERFQLDGFDVDELSVFTTAAAMSKALGQERWSELETKASEDGFTPVALQPKAVIEAASRRREVPSSNLIGMLPGTVPESGAVLLLAHWDHFGNCGVEGDEDRLCNGAADNASGLAVMLELGKRLAAQGPYDRDIYVLATTAEEWGLLGAQAFAENPPVPLEDIVAAFNFDTVAIAPRGTAVGFVGEGRTALDTIVREVVNESGRGFGSPILAEQFLQRQDGWALLQRDVPSVVISSAFGNEEALNAYLAARYHQAGDEAEMVELGGAIEDLLLHEELVKRIADTARYPAVGE